MISEGLVLVRFALAVMNLTQRFVRYLDEQKLLSDAARALWDQAVERIHVKNQMASAARQRVLDELARNPDNVRAPDTNERTD